MLIALNRSFHPSPSSASNVRDDSFLERYKLCGNKTRDKRSYIATAGRMIIDNAMPNQASVLDTDSKPGTLQERKNKEIKRSNRQKKSMKIKDTEPNARTEFTVLAMTHHRGILGILLGLHEPVENSPTVLLVDVDVAREHVEAVLDLETLRTGKSRPINLVRKRLGAVHGCYQSGRCATSKRKTACRKNS